MANLQALGADNNTIIYLSAVGHGTQASPFKSIFAAEQYGAWTVTLLNPSLEVTGNFFPEIQAVSQSGVWAITVDNQLTGYATDLKQDEILVELNSINAVLAGALTVETELEQPLTDSQLRASPVTVDTQHQQALTHTELVSEPLPLPVGAANATNQLSIPGFNIPEYDTLITTEDANGELVSVQYKKSGATVKTLNFTYSDVVFSAPYRTTTVEAV